MAGAGGGRPLAKGLVGALLLLFLWGCQTTMVPTNQPLPQDAQGMPLYSGGSLLPMLQQPQGQIVFIMAFSGDGKRSSAPESNSLSRT